jgi:paraquat-inducible protein B
MDKVGSQTETLAQLQQTMGVARSAFAEDAPLQQNVGQTLLEVQRTARSVRALTDLLGRNPEALLRGRPHEDVSGSTGPAATEEFKQ